MDKIEINIESLKKIINDNTELLKQLNISQNDQYKMMLEYIKSGDNNIAAKIYKANDDVKRMTSEKINDIKNLFKESPEKLNNFLTTIGLTDLTSGLKNESGNKFNMMINSIKNGNYQIAEEIYKDNDEIKRKVRENVENIKQTLQNNPDAMKKFINNIKESNIAKEFRDMFDVEKNNSYMKKFTSALEQFGFNKKTKVDDADLNKIRQELTGGNFIMHDVEILGKEIIYDEHMSGGKDDSEDEDEEDDEYEDEENDNLDDLLENFRTEQNSELFKNNDTEFNEEDIFIDDDDEFINEPERFSEQKKKNSEKYNTFIEKIKKYAKTKDGKKITSDDDAKKIREIIKVHIVNKFGPFPGLEGDTKKMEMIEKILKSQKSYDEFIKDVDIDKIKKIHEKRKKIREEKKSSEKTKKTKKNKKKNNRLKFNEGYLNTSEFIYS